MGVNLVSYAARRRAGMEARAAQDAVNDFGRVPIGEGKEEQVHTTYCRAFGWFDLLLTPQRAGIQ